MVIHLQQMPAYSSQWVIHLRDTAVTLAAGGTRFINATVDFSGKPDDLLPLPKIQVTVPYNAGNRFVFACALPVDSRNFQLQAVPVAACTRLTNPAHLDGSIDSGEWSSCAVLDDFKTAGDAAAAKFATRAYMGYDDKNIYLAVRAQEPVMAKLRAKARPFDDPDIWKDDGVELFFDTKFDRKTYIHYTLNTAGAFADARKSGDMLKPDPAWNGEITIATGKTDSAWTLEIAVPYKTLGIEYPKPGTRMGFEISRTRAQRPDEVSQWSPTGGGNHIPDRFGILEFK